MKPNSNVCGPSVHSTLGQRIKVHIACRACGFDHLEQYLDLGNQAPANALRSPADTTPEFMAPLSISWCPACGLSQLDQVIEPEILYRNYPFRAGVSAKWKSHCSMLMTSFEAPGRHFLLDIGSNDGTLLWEAADRGWKVLGVDPSPATVLPSMAVLWNSGVARSIARIHGQADVVTATNVFGHVDDAKDFLEGVAIVLKPRGIAIIECPHIFPLLEHVAFDTIYHEHLSYWSLRPLEMLAESVGLKVIDVRMYAALHGGTMRYVLTAGDQKTHVKTSVTGLRVLESAHFQQGIKPYGEFAEGAKNKIQFFQDRLLAKDWAGKTIWGYGANAKGAVLLQAAGISEETLRRVVDDTPEKQGLLMPGSRIPVTNAEDLSEPDILVLLSWNNADELKAKARRHGFAGEFLVA